MTKKVLLSLLPIAALLFSCTLNQNSDSSTPGESQDSSSAAQSSPSSSSSQDGEAGYYKAESINDNVSLRKISDTQDTPILPSVGTFDVLVLPVEFTDCPFTDRQLEEISIAVGEDASATNYWETLPSYYEKSSYGRLDINCTMADPVDLGMTADVFIGNSNSLYFSGGDYSSLISEAIDTGLTSYKKQHGNSSTQVFDSDQDGYIDATIVIYSAPSLYQWMYECQLGMHQNYDYAQMFWAFTYYDFYSEPSLNSPTAFTYFWASYDFFETSTEGEVDTHTLCHEFGHVLGADDYYDADYEEGGQLNVAGGALMMDLNAGDHDMVTKMLYGWVEPYVVTDDCTITISPSTTSGDVIIFSDGWNGTGFDEYIAIEFYSPTGLNQFDTTHNSTSYGNIPNDYGIRVWHADMRLVYGPGYEVSSNFADSGYLTDEQTASFDYPERCAYLGKPYYSEVAVGASNSDYGRCQSLLGSNIYALQLIQAGGRYTLYDDNLMMTGDDLFKEGDSFSPSLYTDFLPNGKWNGGSDVNFEFHIDSLTPEKATISFTKIA